jgi:hypothetical protein
VHDLLRYPTCNQCFYIQYSFFIIFFQHHVVSSLNPMTKDGTLGLVAESGQPADVLALTGSLPNKSFDGSIAILLMD